MARYVDADKLIAEYDRVHIGPPGGARKLMEEAPTADVAKVKHGEWQVFKFRNPQCSRCHRDNIAKSRYCPHCGAKMDGGKEE